MRARVRNTITAVAWSAVALASTAETYLYTQRSAEPAAFATILASQVPCWMLCALVTAPIIALSHRAPLTWPLRGRALAAHAAAMLATAAGFTTTYTFAIRVFPWQTLHTPWTTALWINFASWSPFMLVAYACIAGFGHATAYAAQIRREQVEKAALATQLVEAQLGALRMQLQPHFLFNTLNSVAMLIRGADHARAVDMLAQLGGVLRALLRRSGDLEATLASELEFLRGYVELEQVRFGDRLRVYWWIDGAATAGLVPPLILQPLVENALRHGLWPRAGGGELAISARRDGEVLALEVRDDGLGLAPGFDLAGAGGVGLGNVRTRLERMYGAAASFAVAAAAPRGVCVRLRVPFRVAPRFSGVQQAPHA